MKPTNFFLAALVFTTLGVVIGAGGWHRISKDENANLRKEVQRREQRVDSLRVLVNQLTDSLHAAGTVKTIEIIKYEKIKPKSYTVPALDSFFMSKYR